MTYLVSELDFDAIERYLRHEMPEAERMAFEQRLHDEAGLHEAVKEFDLLIQGVGMAVLKEKMNSFHNQLGKRKLYNIKRLASFSLTQYMVAASFLLLLAFTAWWFATQRPAHMKLYAAYFAPDPGLITPMSADVDFIFYDAMVDYKLHDYDKAISKWESLLLNKPANDTLNSFIGVAELARGHAEASVPLLQFVTTQEESAFADDAFFYLGMAQLNLGHLSDAIETLENTTNQRGKSVLLALKKRQSK